MSTGLLTVDAAAEYLAISPKHLLKLVRDGKIQFVSIGLGKKRFAYRFRQSDLDTFIQGSSTWQNGKVASSKGRGARSGTTISACGVIDFRAALERPTGGKREKSCATRKRPHLHLLPQPPRP